MAAREDAFDADLAARGDDRPGLDEVEGDDFSRLDLDYGDEVDDEDDLDDDTDDDEIDDDEDSDDEDEDGDDEDDLDEDDEDDYPEDAVDEEIDLVAAFYREDGVPAGTALAKDLANDLDALVDALRRVPGDAGSVGMVSIDSEFFVLVRVRGRKVQLMLSDVVAGNDWPLARDVVDFLGVEPAEDDDDSEPVGDLDLFADVGLSEMDLEALASDDDADPLDALEEIAGKLGFSAPYDKVAAEFDL